ncbi:MAG TPA: ChaN family lipoprotein [Longimicrobiaceae bacterium]
MRRPTLPLRRAISAALALFAALAAAPPLPAQTPADSVPHRVYDARAGRWTDFAALADSVAAADVAFVGEQHDDGGTHRLQRALLEALAARGERVVVAMEMFERDVQPLLDRYLAGEAPESAFVAGSRPWPNYAADYRPLVELARERGWPVVAGNVPRRIASAVSRRGADTLASLSAAERAWVAAERRCPRDAYHARFAEQMRAHPMPGTAEEQAAATDRFYLAQCAKDETMAESVARARERHGPGALVVHFNGAFHTDRRLGIVPRLERRAPGARVLVVSAVPVPDPERVDPAEFRDRGDFILFTRRPPPGS